MASEARFEMHGMISPPFYPNSFARWCHFTIGPHYWGQNYAIYCSKKNRYVELQQSFRKEKKNWIFWRFGLHNRKNPRITKSIAQVRTAMINTSNLLQKSVNLLLKEENSWKLISNFQKIKSELWMSEDLSWKQLTLKSLSSLLKQEYFDN